MQRANPYLFIRSCRRHRQGRSILQAQKTHLFCHNYRLYYYFGYLCQLLTPSDCTTYYISYCFQWDYLIALNPHTIFPAVNSEIKGCKSVYTSWITFPKSLLFSEVIKQWMLLLNSSGERDISLRINRRIFRIAWKIILGGCFRETFILSVHFARMEKMVKRRYQGKVGV